MASLGTSSQSTRARISLNSFLCYTGNLVNVVYSILEAIFNEGVYTWVLKIVTDGQTDSLTNLIKCVVVYRSYSYAFCHYGLLVSYYIVTLLYEFNHSGVSDISLIQLRKAIVIVIAQALNPSVYLKALKPN